MDNVKVVVLILVKVIVLTSAVVIVALIVRELHMQNYQNW